jgi:nucleoside-diphosphate-sugar epimerase
VPVPELAVGAAADVVARLPFVPAEAQWIESLRRPVIMDTSRARDLLDWAPEHDARETLEQMVRAARAERLIR